MSMELDGRPVADAYRSILDFLSESSNDYFYFLDFQTERVYLSKNICKDYDLPRSRSGAGSSILGICPSCGTRTGA